MHLSSSQTSWQRFGMWVAFFALLSFVFVNQAFAAGTTGSEFQGLYEMVRDWSTGYLGKTIAVTFLLVGLGMGIVRGSVMAAVCAIAAGVALLMLPGIIDAMFNVTP